MCADPINTTDLDGVWCVFGHSEDGSCRGSGVVKKLANTKIGTTLRGKKDGCSLKGAKNFVGRNWRTWSYLGIAAAHLVSFAVCIGAT